MRVSKFIFMCTHMFVFWEMSFNISHSGKFQVQANAESFPQYGAGPGSWGAYDLQRAQGPR